MDGLIDWLSIWTHYKKEIKTGRKKVQKIINRFHSSMRFACLKGFNDKFTFNDFLHLTAKCSSILVSIIAIFHWHLWKLRSPHMWDLIVLLVELQFSIFFVQRTTSGWESSAVRAVVGRGRGPASWEPGCCRFRHLRHHWTEWTQCWRPAAVACNLVLVQQQALWDSRWRFHPTIFYMAYSHWGLSQLTFGTHIFKLMNYVQSSIIPVQVNSIAQCSHLLMTGIHGLQPVHWWAAQTAGGGAPQHSEVRPS